MFYIYILDWWAARILLLKEQVIIQMGVSAVKQFLQF